MRETWATLSAETPISEVTAALLARRVVAVAEHRDGITLDYAPHSLLAVDHIVESFRNRAGSKLDREAALVGLGCYVGEVIARQAGGHWQTTASRGTPGTSRWPVVLGLPGGARLDPIEAVFRRHELGPMKSVFALFRALIDLSRCA